MVVKRILLLKPDVAHPDDRVKPSADEKREILASLGADGLDFVGFPFCGRWCNASAMEVWKAFADSGAHALATNPRYLPLTERVVLLRDIPVFAFGSKRQDAVRSVKLELRPFDFDASADGFDPHQDVFRLADFRNGSSEVTPAEYSFFKKALARAGRRTARLEVRSPGAPKDAGEWATRSRDADILLMQEGQLVHAFGSLLRRRPPCLHVFKGVGGYLEFRLSLSYVSPRA